MIPRSAARPQFGGGLARRAAPQPATPVEAPISSLARRGLTPPKGREISRTASWWTARAREAEVKPGFTKEEILRPVREDPRGPEGVLTRVGELLRRLVELG